LSGLGQVHYIKANALSRARATTARHEHKFSCQ
jgi:hypothetical protein